MPNSTFMQFNMYVNNDNLKHVMTTTIATRYFLLKDFRFVTFFSEQYYRKCNTHLGILNISAPGLLTLTLSSAVSAGSQPGSVVSEYKIQSEIKSFQERK